MRIRLCVLLATVHAARRVRHISSKPAGVSAAEVPQSENPLDDALTLSHAGEDLGIRSQVAGNRSTSLLQLKPSEDADPKITYPQQAKADLAAAIKHRTDPRLRLVAEKEFEEVLQGAISGIMEEAKAVAKAAHDQVFHHGYYRAVKAETAAKAAKEASKKAVKTALQKAKVVGREVVFMKLLEHTELGTGATVKQLLDIIDGQVKEYVKNTRERLEQYPAMVGLEALSEEMKAMEERVRARKGEVFDCEAMTELMLDLIHVMNKALYFEYKINHETKSIARFLQQDFSQEMSNKMKSELGLHGFLKDVIQMESIMNPGEEVKGNTSI